ncbi:MAG: hypothetical protein HC838_02385 [Spirulinaceae cyanobacterium RM2_2_10]|nr:hypothetical protein [Spirulinaceae cyanobacterium RM2_2_10]
MGDRDPETSAVEVVPAAAAPIPPAWQEEFPTESTPVAQPPDFRQWVELRLEARARDRQAAAEAAAAPRSSYRYYPRPYYSRATIPDELKISPFNLVYRAYQGGFKDSEIPSYGALLTAYRSGKIAPEDLVRAGIVQGRLTAADLYDQSYLQAVKSQMENLD